LTAADRSNPALCRAMCLTCGEVIHTRRDQKFALRSRQERPVRPRVGVLAESRVVLVRVANLGTPSVRKGCLLKQPGLDPSTQPSRPGGMTNGNGDHVRAAAARSGNTAALQYSERYVLRYRRVACPPQEPARTGRVTGTSREGVPVARPVGRDSAEGSTPVRGWRRNLLDASRCGARARGHHPPWPTRGFRLIRPRAGSGGRE